MDKQARRTLRDRVRKSLWTAHDSVINGAEVIEFPVTPHEANIIVAWNAEYQRNEQAAGRAVACCGPRPDTLIEEAAKVRWETDR